MPTFWLALLLQILFVDIYLKWHVRIFYTSGSNNPHHGTWSLDRLAAHRATGGRRFCIISFALLQPVHARLDARRDQQRLRAHGAREGLPEWRVIMRHVLRNALIPIVTDRRAELRRTARRRDHHRDRLHARRHGLLLHPEAQATDLYAVMAYLVVTSVIIIVFNLIADILYGYLDPRIRYD